MNRTNRVKTTNLLILLKYQEGIYNTDETSEIRTLQFA